MKKLETTTVDEILSALIPSNATAQLPDPDLLSYYKDLDNRVIWVGDIDDSCVNISQQIIRWNLEDRDIPVENRKPIKIMIFSYGGDGATCFNIVDTILMSKTPVYTYNMGVAMSAGAIILMSGHKRFCTKYSTCLIHSGSGGATGTYEQSEAKMKDYKHFVNNMRDFIIERTQIDQKLLNKKKAEEWYIYSDEQESLGIVNSIIEDINDLI